MITLDAYFAGYAGHPEVTEEMLRRAEVLLARVNALLEAAILAGVPLHYNPVNGSYISGQRNGGFRISTAAVGAPRSQHRQARAVDVYDPGRALATWAIANPDELRERGLWMEDPRWTPTWLHLQGQPPGSGKWVFVPTLTPPLADPVEGQVV